MAQPREKLHEILVDILGSPYVYYQPDASVKMKYPCIRYKFHGQVNNQADNINYIRTRQYQVVFMSRSSSTEVIDKILDLPMSSVDRTWTYEGLYHTSITLYF